MPLHYKGLNIDSEYAAVMTSIISLVRYCREKGVTGWEVNTNTNHSFQSDKSQQLSF